MIATLLLAAANVVPSTSTTTSRPAAVGTCKPERQHPSGFSGLFALGATPVKCGEPDKDACDGEGRRLLEFEVEPSGQFPEILVPDPWCVNPGGLVRSSGASGASWSAAG